MNFDWNDGTVTKLKRLWQDGVSASQIAARLGSVTRNAVIGKIHRMGLEGGSKPLRSAAATRAKSRVRTRMTASHGGLAVKLKNANGRPPTSKPPVPEPPKPPMCEPVALMELAGRHCRWPLGNPNGAATLFCGAVKPVEGTYCDWHLKIAYQPPQERRRRELERLARVV